MSGVDVSLSRPDSDGNSASPLSRQKLQRVSSPRRFRALRSAPLRARSGPLRVSWAPHGSALSVAFAIPTSVGNAVVRNTVRRRLRAIVAQSSDHFPSGDLLVRVVGAGQNCTWSVLQVATASIGSDLSRRRQHLALELSSSDGTSR